MGKGRIRYVWRGKEMDGSGHNIREYLNINL
ncbi:MAG: hypothetical protein JWO08_2488, partial [Verrucomicrobiaceae bacterium]|nr:hypothetical protein [Verrucomicrobiaceae bacterium]